MDKNIVNEVVEKVDGRTTRTKFYRRYETKFEPTWWLKEEFLEVGAEQVMKNSFNKHTLYSMKLLMNKVGKWECRYNKDLYDFTTEEIKGMLKEFNSSSYNSLMAQKSNIQYYLMYAHEVKHLGNSNVPATVDLTADEIRYMVNPIGREAKYVTREQFYNAIEPQFENGMLSSGLYNSCDRAFMSLNFEGILGKRGEDLINLKWRDIENGLKEGRIIYKNREIQLDYELIMDLEQTINDEYYYTANGKYANELGEYVPPKNSDGTERELRRKPNHKIVDKYESEYLFRTIDHYNTGDGKVTYGAMQQRLLADIKTLEGCECLTFKSIYISGLIDRALTYNRENYDNELMPLKDFVKWLDENDEHIGIQPAYELLKEFWNKENGFVEV